MVSSHDLIIVGAGPAGCAAAITAVRHGLDVVVVDKATFPRDKCCGDGLTSLALRELDQLGLDPARLPSWERIDHIDLRSPRGRRTTLSLPGRHGLHAAVVRRIELDNELVRLSRSLGAEIREGVAVGEVVPGPTEVRVDLADGSTATAPWLIAADGMWSPVRRQLGLTPDGYRGDWHAFRQYFHASSPDSRRLWVWFEPDLLPGYAWSFPLQDGVVNVGFGVVRDGGLDGGALKEIWTGLLDRPHIRAALGETTPIDQHKAWPIPASLPSATLSHGRVLFVGDAAAVTDPMTGEGIGQALETGIAAADSVVARGAHGDAAGRYERLARASLQLDHRMAGALGRLLAKPGLAHAAIRAIDFNDWTRRNFARWMFEDYPRAALLTPRRWSSMRANEGAFAT